MRWSCSRVALLSLLGMLPACARGAAGMLFEDAGADDDEPTDAGPDGACERGATQACSCPNGGSGWRTCQADPTSPRFGFFTACGECTTDDVDGSDGGPGIVDGPRCDDGVANGGESDVDCGGPCAGCADGRLCTSSSDCQGTCEDGVCRGGAISFRNFDRASYDYSNEVDFSCAGTTRFDSTGDGAFIQTTSCSNQANQRPTFTCGVEQTTAGGPSVCILRARGLTLGPDHILELVGDKPVILAVEGDASVLGTISADALGILPGAGGNQSCGASQGGAGQGDFARGVGASGGGGGGFGTPGGLGGTADTDGTLKVGGAAGAMRGEANGSPLLGGCAGGQAGGCTGEPGAGGGAIQLAVTGRLVVRGAVHADGGLGTTPCGAVDEGGGTGGGSGGTVLLQALQLDVTGATLRARGGAGGQNGAYVGVYTCGNSGAGAGAVEQVDPGADATSCQGGGGGGGGGYGRVIVD